MKLTVEMLTPEAFTEFGDVISTETARDSFGINQGTTTRYHDISGIDASEEGGRPIISIFRGNPRPLPIRIAMMERHPLGSQAFVPMQGQRFLIVVAPASDLPMANDLRAFVTNGKQGITYDKGVWHHPLLVLEPESEFLIIDRAGPGNNLNEVDMGDIDGMPISLDWPPAQMAKTA
jgi:ureidoglycolate lyase